MELSGLEKCHLRRLLMSDLILGLILDLPECAEQGSRCSLRLVFTFLTCFEIACKLISKLTFLRLKIAAGSHMGASRTTCGSHFCASELKLKNVSKMYRIGSRFDGLEAGCPTIEAPSNLHRISIESPSNLYRICMESPSNLHRSPSSKHRLRSDEGPLQVYQMVGISRHLRQND